MLTSIHKATAAWRVGADATRFDSLVNVEKKLKQAEHDKLSVTAHKFLIDIIRLKSRNIIESTDRLKCGPMAPIFQLLA